MLSVHTYTHTSVHIYFIHTYICYKEKENTAKEPLDFNGQNSLQFCLFISDIFLIVTLFCFEGA